jgi:hypothetical protein
MPVMTAIRTDGEIKDLYDRLKRKGKKGGNRSVRKMLVQLNAIMKRELKKLHKLFTLLIKLSR